MPDQTPPDPNLKRPFGALADAIGSAGAGLLDAAETLLFGHVGGAEEALRDHSDIDPLERLRAEAALRRETQPSPDLPRPDPEAKAREQLAALKASLTTQDPAPAKRTL